jgi:hypothetical protein
MFFSAIYRLCHPSIAKIARRFSRNERTKCFGSPTFFSTTASKVPWLSSRTLRTPSQKSSLHLHDPFIWYEDPAHERNRVRRIFATFRRTIHNRYPCTTALVDRSGNAARARAHRLYVNICWLCISCQLWEFNVMSWTVSQMMSLPIQS